MDDKLKNALEYSNYMITLNNQKRILLEQYQNDLMYYFNGGEFIVSQQLISFCQSLLQLNQVDAVITDDSGTPIEIENLQEFTNNLVAAYFKASNRYLTEYTKLKQNRSVEGIVLE